MKKRNVQVLQKVISPEPPPVGKSFETAEHEHRERVEKLRMLKLYYNFSRQFFDINEFKNLSWCWKRTQIF